MKKLIASALFSLIAFGSFATEGHKAAEHWITVGARGTFNSTWLMNKNMMHDKGLKYQPSFGGSGGIMLGFHLSTIVAINVEGLYSQYNQKMKSAIDSLKWSSKTTLNYLEFPVLLHFDFENFKYLEFGVRFGILNSAKYNATFDDFPAGNETNKDVKKNYESNTTGIVFGWGGGIWGNGGLLISGGIRLTYGLSDIVSDEGGKGDDYYTLKDFKKESYTKTSTATIGFHLNADFDLGWMVKSSCGRTHKFVLFSH